jgi:Fic family protein
VWIGGTRPGNTAFVPPPADAVPECLAALERFLNDDPEPVLQLVTDGVLREPMLYPSLFFKTHRALYYELLNEVRLRGDWERWLDFFAEGIEASATHAVATATALLALVNADRDRIAGLGRAAASALAVHQALQRQPIATAAALVKATRLTPATVNKSLAHLERIGIVAEITHRQRGRVFSYLRYVEELTAELREHG